MEKSGIAGMRMAMFSWKGGAIMIYTLTLNPSLDYLVELESLKPGKINRADSEELAFGGKGVNVSVMLKHLNVDSVALGFTAGVTAELYEHGVCSYGITPSFLRVKNGFTRINVKILDEEETGVNGQGPQPDAQEVEQLLSLLDQLKDGDVLVMAGSVPKSVPDTIYAQMMRRVSDGVLCIVDTGGSAFLHVLEEGPFLIKPSIRELEEIFHCPMKEGVLLSSMHALQQRGVRNVLVSCGEKGAYLLDEHGGFYFGKSPAGRVINTTGAGDAMVAGFLKGWMQTNDYMLAFKRGIAAGSATAFCKGMADAESVKRLYAKVDIEIMREPVMEG